MYKPFTRRPPTTTFLERNSTPNVAALPSLTTRPSLYPIIEANVNPTIVEEPSYDFSSPKDLIDTEEGWKMPSTVPFNAFAGGVSSPPNHYPLPLSPLSLFTPISSLLYPMKSSSIVSSYGTPRENPELLVTEGPSSVASNRSTSYLTSSASDGGISDCRPSLLDVDFTDWLWANEDCERMEDIENVNVSPTLLNDIAQFHTFEMAVPSEGSASTAVFPGTLVSPKLEMKREPIPTEHFGPSMGWNSLTTIEKKSLIPSGSKSELLAPLKVTLSKAPLLDLKSLQPSGSIQTALAFRSAKCRSSSACSLNGSENSSPVMNARKRRHQSFDISHVGYCHFPNCTKKNQGGQFCIKHGGGKRCTVQGCNKSIQSRGLCKAHGGGPRCELPGCTKSSQGQGRCRRHGGGRRCAMPNCPKGAQWGNYCASHGGTKTCEIEGCERLARSQSRCATHGGGVRCNVFNCNKPARKEHKCTQHYRESLQQQQLAYQALCKDSYEGLYPKVQ